MTINLRSRGVKPIGRHTPTKGFQDFALHRSRCDRLYYRTAAFCECPSECPAMTDWEAVVGQHVEIVRHTVYRLVGNDADAWDCVQETFLDAVRIDRRGPVRDWPALLRHLATAQSMDLLRKRSREALSVQRGDGPCASNRPGAKSIPSGGGKRTCRPFAHRRGPTAPSASSGFLPDLLRADDLRGGWATVGHQPRGGPYVALPRTGVCTRSSSLCKARREKMLEERKDGKSRRLP